VKASAFAGTTQPLSPTGEEKKTKGDQSTQGLEVALIQQDSYFRAVSALPLAISGTSGGELGLVFLWGMLPRWSAVPGARQTSLFIVVFLSTRFYFGRRVF
jgi:hypothetical protein